MECCCCRCCFWFLVDSHCILGKGRQNRLKGAQTSIKFTTEDMVGCMGDVASGDYACGYSSPRLFQGIFTTTSCHCDLLTSLLWAAHVCDCLACWCNSLFRVTTSLANLEKSGNLIFRLGKTRGINESWGKKLRKYIGAWKIALVDRCHLELLLNWLLVLL